MPGSNGSEWRNGRIPYRLVSQSTASIHSVPRCTEPGDDQPGCESPGRVLATQQRSGRSRRHLDHFARGFNLHPVAAHGSIDGGRHYIQSHGRSGQITVRLFERTDQLLFRELDLTTQPLTPVALDAMHIAPHALVCQAGKGFAFCVKRDRVVRRRTTSKKVTVRHPAIQAIREARIRAGKTLEQAAGEKAPSTIQRWEQGSMPRSWWELENYAAAIGQPITLIFGANETAAPDIPERLEAAVARLETTTSGLSVLLEAGRRAAIEATRKPDEPLRDGAAMGQGAPDPKQG